MTTIECPSCKKILKITRQTIIYYCKECSHWDYYEAKSSYDRKAWDCPKCRKTVMGYPAISRRDNKTRICSECGMKEALFDFFTRLARREGKEDISKITDKEQAWLSKFIKKIKTNGGI